MEAIPMLFGPIGIFGVKASELWPFVSLGEDRITAAQARPPVRLTRRAACRRRAKSPRARGRRRQAVKEDRSSGVSSQFGPESCLNDLRTKGSVQNRLVGQSIVSPNSGRSLFDSIPSARPIVFI